MSAALVGEQIGASTYIQFVDDGTEGGKPTLGDPLVIASIHTDLQKRREGILDLVEPLHNSAGLDIPRVARFLGRYGLALPSCSIIPSEHASVLDPFFTIANPEEGDDIHGVYDERLDLTFVFRDKQFEALNGPGATESVLVHEGTHANNGYPLVGFAILDDGDYVAERLRSGFRLNTVEDYGSYQEEGLSGLLEHRYTIEELGLPGGFTDERFAQLLCMGNQELYKMPKSYFRFSNKTAVGSVPVAAHAAFGLELLIQKDSAILPAMTQGRHDPEGLREFAQRVNALAPGLYRTMSGQPYKELHFMAVTRHIIERLYDGDFNKAASVVLN